MKHGLRTHLARYGYNVGADISYRDQFNDRLKGPHLGRKAPGSELVSGNVKSTDAYLERVRKFQLMVAHGDEAKAEEWTADQLQDDAKAGAWALVRRVAIVGFTAVLVLGLKDIYDGNSAESAIEGGLVALGLGKLALGPQAELAAANPAEQQPAPLVDALS